MAQDSCLVNGCMNEQLEIGRMSGKLSKQIVKSLATPRRGSRREEEALEAVLGLIHSGFKGRL